jgi:hypothetical protein
MTAKSMSIDLLEAFQKGLEEILPADQIRNLLGENLGENISPESAAEKAVVEFGPVAASGLFFRSGSAAFKHIVYKHGKAIGIDSLEFRLQPQRDRLQDGVEKIAIQLKNWQTANLMTKRTGDAMEIIVKPVHHGQLSGGQRVWLYFIAGMFQEFLYWAGGGKQYPFQTGPSQKGDSLVICFQLQPVD